jgi:hypothetical protein
MTEEKKHEDKDRKKLSDEEMEDVAGGDVGGHLMVEATGIRKERSKERMKKKFDKDG